MSQDPLSIKRILSILLTDVTHDCLKMTNSAFQSGDYLLNQVLALAIHLLI